LPRLTAPEHPPNHIPDAPLGRSSADGRRRLHRHPRRRAALRHMLPLPPTRAIGRVIVSSVFTATSRRAALRVALGFVWVERLGGPVRIDSAAQRFPYCLAAHTPSVSSAKLEAENLHHTLPTRHITANPFVPFPRSCSVRTIAIAIAIAIAIITPPHTLTPSLTLPHSRCLMAPPSLTVAAAAAAAAAAGGRAPIAPEYHILMSLNYFPFPRLGATCTRGFRV